MNKNNLFPSQVRCTQSSQVWPPWVAHKTAPVRCSPLPISIILSMMCNWWTPWRLWVFTCLDEQTDIQRAGSSSLTLKDKPCLSAWLTYQRRASSAIVKGFYFQTCFLRKQHKETGTCCVCSHKTITVIIMIPQY